MSERATIRFDPHVHTAASYDAVGSVHSVLSCAYNAGLDAVAITDHDAIENALVAAGLADRYGLVVVPGVEVSTADGHLLALGVERRPPEGRPLAATVEWVRRRGGIAVVPHPFQVSRHGVRRRDVTGCDGIEVFNAWAMTGIQNRRARAFARDRGYPRLGGSDAHEPAMVARSYTDVTLPDGVSSSSFTRADLLDAIRDGATRAAGTSTPTRHYLRKYARSVELKTGELRRSLSRC